MNSLGLPTLGQQRQASWAPLGRPVTCRAAHDGNPLGRYMGCAHGREIEPVWARAGSFGPWPYSRAKTFSIFQTIFQFANYFEFNSNLNFE
jgi:hypothetical protein